MTKRYFDQTGRPLREEALLRDLLGRNRELAMEILGVARRAPDGPRWPLRPVECTDDEGRPVIRLVPNEDAGD